MFVFSSRYNVRGNTLLLKMVSRIKHTGYAPYFRPRWQTLYPISDQKCLKTAPFRAAHTYMAYISEYPPSPPPPPPPPPRIPSDDVKKVSHVSCWNRHTPNSRKDLTTRPIPWRSSLLRSRPAALITQWRMAGFENNLNEKHFLIGQTNRHTDKWK